MACQACLEFGEVVQQVVGEAATLAEARGMLDDVHVALVDLGLPDGDGSDLIAELREVEPNAHAVVLSAALDRSVVARAVERGVHLLDSAIPIPGTRLRVGLDPLLGLTLPAVGDAVAGFVSLGVLFLAVQYRVPSRVIGTMVFNVAVDTLVGGIPVVGDVFDFAWKANDRNFELLMTHRGDVSKRGTIGYWLTVVGLLLLGLACVAAPIALVIWLARRYL